MLVVYLVGVAALADMCLLRLKHSVHETACEVGLADHPQRGELIKGPSLIG